MNHVGGVYEYLGMTNYGTPRDEYDFISRYVPFEYITGALAESWEQPDPTTIVFNIRKGVHYHDKAPMNGREFNAYDVEFSLHRMYGFSDKYGFTEPSTAFDKAAVPAESVEATDEWTVVVKLSTISLGALKELLVSIVGVMQPREVIEQEGDLTNWEYAIGTGPWMLTEYVKGSGRTYLANPDYWGYDEMHPENQLPYADKLRVAQMPELSTQLAALRTGKVDLMRGDVTFPVDVLANLTKTNPSLRIITSEFSSYDFGMKVSEPPFSDLRVRIAMQKSLDLEELNQTYYSGKGDVTPFALASPAHKGLYVPYAEWPKTLQEEFTYDPEAAGELFDEAGYPAGADGTRMEIVWNINPGWDLDLAQILVAEYARVGVVIELKQLPYPEWGEMMRSHNYSGLTNYEGFRQTFASEPISGLKGNYTGMTWNLRAVDDPKFNAMVDAVYAATTMEEYKRLYIETDMYHVSQHWGIMLPHLGGITFAQAWLGGFNGETPSGGSRDILARTWVDQELKAELGF